jgi:putative endonuclease
MDARPALGRTGEDAAAALYERLGFRVIERNFRHPGGEIDIIAANGDVVAFCEVKTRRTDRWGDPSEAVHRVKQMRIRKGAVAWLRERAVGPAKVRFDVVSVIVRNGHIDVRHIPDAF